MGRKVGCSEIVEQDWDRVPHPRISLRRAWDPVDQTFSKRGSWDKSIAKQHDIAYSKAKNLQDKWKADDVMIRAIDRLPGKKKLTEKMVKKIMQAKRRLKL